MRPGHLPDSASIEQELESDYAAIDWISTDELEEESPMFKKRYLGTVLALGVTTARDIHSGKHGGLTHPYAYDRLVNVLAKHIQDKNHVAWAMASVILKLHLDAAGVDIPKTVHEDFRSCVDEYANILSRQSQKDL